MATCTADDQVGMNISKKRKVYGGNDLPKSQVLSSE